jgi:hypothetical protein
MIPRKLHETPILTNYRQIKAYNAMREGGGPILVWHVGYKESMEKSLSGKMINWECKGMRSSHWEITRGPI